MKTGRGGRGHKKGGTADAAEKVEEELRIWTQWVGGSVSMMWDLLGWIESKGTKTQAR